MTASKDRHIEVEDLVVRYGDLTAVAGISFEVHRGEHLTLLGPSGCGKTTTLRALAGLETPASGEIRIDGRPVFSSRRGINVPAERRQLPMVFQSYAIWPHMTVFDNVAYGLRLRRLPRGQVEERVRAALELVRLAELATRSAADLSGGQQQRVALARCLAVSPAVLLLDEPLSNLDARLRAAMRLEIQALQRQIGLTSVYVTHDQEEALTLSDRIAIFNDGRVVQAGRPHDVYERPATAFAANFLGDANFFEGRVTGPGRVAVEGGELVSEDGLPAAGSKVVLAVRPEKISLARPEDRSFAGNRLEGRLTQAVYSGMSTIFKVAVGDRELTVFAQNSGRGEFAPGDAVRLEWLPAHSVVVAP
jgi:iron(III) transport system ATP-binding protein